MDLFNNPFHNDLIWFFMGFKTLDVTIGLQLFLRGLVTMICKGLLLLDLKLMIELYLNASL